MPNMPSQGEETRLTVSAKLRAKLADPGSIVVGPGVYDGITARIALRAGFDCLYMVSYELMECLSRDTLDMTCKCLTSSG